MTLFSKTYNSWITFECCLCSNLHLSIQKQSSIRVLLLIVSDHYYIQYFCYTIFFPNCMTKPILYSFYGDGDCHRSVQQRCIERVSSWFRNLYFSFFCRNAQERSNSEQIPCAQSSQVIPQHFYKIYCRSGLLLGHFKTIFFSWRLSFVNLDLCFGSPLC